MGKPVLFIPGGLKVVTVPFDPATFTKEGYTFWKGSKDGKGLDGEEARNKVSVGLTKVDLGKADFLTCLRKNESSITGEEKLARLEKTGHTLFGATVFAGLLQNYQSCQDKNESVLEKLRQYKGIANINFFGDIIRDMHGQRLILCLYWSGVGLWRYRYRWLGNQWRDEDFSASYTV